MQGVIMMEGGSGSGAHLIRHIELGYPLARAQKPE
jgi:hypothetical protein